MSRPKRRTWVRRASAAALAVAVVAIPTTLAHAQQEGATSSIRLYSVKNVSLSSAAALALSVCNDVHRDAAEAGEIGRCEVGQLAHEDMLAITATAEIHERITMLLMEFDRAPETRAFQIVVLAASRTGPSTTDLPEGAQRALEDIRDFLPYTSFRVLGSGWIRTSGYGETTLPGPMEFGVEIRFRGSSAADSLIMIDGFQVYQAIPARVLPNGETQPREHRSVLETTFSIHPGETVVVGTSRLNGDEEALVVLLTAVSN